MERLYDTFRQTLKSVNTDFVRYLHDEVAWDARMVAIVGSRGVGKTTMLLQHIKLHDKLGEVLYVYADDFYFSEHKLYDTVSLFYKNGGKKIYIDEVHKYDAWSQELKMMYDHFPNLQIVFTGSSILDIYKGSADLSRRVLMYHLAGLSFREYVNISQGLNLPAYSLEEILQNKVELPGVEYPLALFKTYLREGYYPFFSEQGYVLRLRQVLNLMLESDIPIYANMNISSIKKLRQLLQIISQSVPFKPNVSKIAAMMDVHRNKVADYLYCLEKVEVVAQLKDRTGGIRKLGKVEKVYLGNPNILHLLSEDKPNVGNVRETFFYAAMRVRYEVLSSKVADFEIDGITFEVGGKGKGQKQIEDCENGYVVKDDIEYGYQNVVPLWAFGFNY